MNLRDFICNAMQFEMCNILAYDLPKNLEKALIEAEKKSDEANNAGTNNNITKKMDN